MPLVCMKRVSGSRKAVYEVGMIDEVLAHELVARRVGNSSRRNERQQSALVQQFH